ncbi:MAG: hypothetical protein ACR2FK_04040 [Sphingomicrobium sp.]
MAVRKKGAARLTLRGGDLPKKVSGRRSDWTRKMADQFVETLADTCNVTLAAAAIERSIANVYKWRGKDAAFRASWDRALAIGYSRLELMLLERALHGVEKVVVARDGTSSVMREYPDRVALTLLRMHRETAAMADESIDGREHDEACERIIAKLSRLKDRDAAEEASAAAASEEQAGLETKRAGARRAFIRTASTRWALIRCGLKARGR